jgi:hypothetical protein
MIKTQPIVDWFGLEPTYVPPPPRYTKEQRAKNREAPPTPADEHENELDSDSEWFRHHYWKEKRAKVRQALADADTSLSGMFRFDNCGAGCQIEWNKDENRYRIVGSFCHNRHCEPCMKAKSALITNNLRAHLKNGENKQHRFITLTKLHNDAPLKQQIKQLYAQYKKLRATPEWKKTQKGGAATLEIKWIPATRKWHPHLHIITEGYSLSTYTLSALWKQITGDSFIVDIRLISADKDVAYYVGKYVTKGTNDAVWQEPAVAAEWVKAVKGVRMCATFGTWRGYRLLQRPKEETGKWTWIASLASICRRARLGDQWAIRLLIESLEPMQFNPHKKRGQKPK